MKLATMALACCLLTGCVSKDWTNGFVVCMCIAAIIAGFNGINRRNKPSDQ